MLKTADLDQMTLHEKWGVLSVKETCPVRLVSFVGSRLIEPITEGDGSTELLVELAPGMAIDGIYHLSASLASFFDSAVNSVHTDPVPEKARRVRITIGAPTSET